MQERPPRPGFSVIRFCGHCVLSMAVWTGWLVLLVALAIQVYLASEKQLQVPAFLLRAVEEHLAASGVTVTFGKAVFDPSGRLLIEKARFRLATFDDPVVTADALYIRLDPWSLLERKFEARQIRATGANLYVPAMLSSTGRPEKVIENLDAQFSIAPRGDEFLVDYLNCSLGGIFLTAHGTVNAGTPGGAQPAQRLPLADFVARNYVALSREFSSVEERLAGLDHATLSAVLVPSDTRGAIVHAELSAEGLKLSDPLPIDATNVRISARFPLLGGAPLKTSLTASAEGISLAGRASGTGIRAHLRGVLSMDTLSFVPSELEIAAATLSVQEVPLVAPVLRASPVAGWPRSVSAQLATDFYGSLFALAGTADLSGKSAQVSFDGALSPAFLDALADRLKLPLRHFADLHQPVAVDGRVNFGPGWKFTDVAAHVDGRDFEAYHVKFDEARAVVTYDGRFLRTTEATVVAGDYLAMGSYTQDFDTLEFRYLLTGHIRPLYITPWFGGTWWTGIFDKFGMPDSPAEATIDVQGQYLHGRLFSVFGYAAVKKPELMKIPFDSLRTLIYVDQNACKVFEFKVAQGSGSAQGSVRLDTEPVDGNWSGFDLEATSTIDPTCLGSILPPDGASAVRAFSFDRPPMISAKGHFDGPAAVGIPHKKLHADVRSDGPLKVHGVAFERAAFSFDVNDDDIDVTDVEAGFAGGIAKGKATLSGAGKARRFQFKTTLTDASFGQAAAAAAGYVQASTPGKSTALATFAKEKAGVRLDLNVSGDGPPGDLSGFVGDGNFQIQGAELGEISLLGGLSKLFKVTALRFTQASAQFTIKDGSLVFPSLNVIGANSAIQAKGSYVIEPRQLDFAAKIYPFKESKSLLQIFNALSTPLSSFFEVKLLGSIDKPTWTFAMNPLNILKSGDAKTASPDKPALPSPLANPPPSPGTEASGKSS